VRNSEQKGVEHPEDNLWPEWQPFDTTATKRTSRMLIALDTGLVSSWDIEFPSIKKTFSIAKNDACKFVKFRSDSSVLVEFIARWHVR
jgi:hypothetical protein